MSQRDIYLMGICGTGMGALAGMLKGLGHRVRGSDEHVYPPMSDKLREWGIEVLEGYDAEHLRQHALPDLVVVGNVIRRDNPEAVCMRELGLPYLSMPQVVAQFGIGERHSLVVTGTHGKTTTSALAAHVLVHAGKDPSFLVGGVMVGYPDTFRVGGGDVFVVEGDEYDTAYFDKGPKFLHYRASTAIITSLEFDHADIYNSIEDIEGAFAKLIEAVRPDGHLVVWRGAERAVQLAQQLGGERKITIYDHTPNKMGELTVESVEQGPQGLTIAPVYRGEHLGDITVPMWGAHSAQNVLAVIGALVELGIEPAALRAGLESFAGVRRRLEVLGRPNDVTVVDDFGHHPTAVAETLKGARVRWPESRLWAVFEPRSATSRRNIFEDAYVGAFKLADACVLGSHARLTEVDAAQRFSPERVAQALNHKGVVAAAIERPDDIAEYLAQHAQPGDVVIIFSNGDFGGLHNKLLHRMEQR